MDRLCNELARIFETTITRYVSDPWSARDDYIAVILDRSPASRKSFFEQHAVRQLTYEEKRDTLKLLEMERNAMLMFTSCGWFFDDISGIESIQVMKYACRAMQLASEVSETNPEPDFLNALSRITSGNPDHLDAATIYLDYVKKSMIDLNRIVFTYALTRLVTDSPDLNTIRHYTTIEESFGKEQAGELRMIGGTLTLRSEITCKQKRLEYAVLHLGNFDFLGGVREYSGVDSFTRLQAALRAALHEGNTARMIAIMDQEFGTSTYSLWHLFKDAQRDILCRLLESTLTELESSFRQIYRQHITLIHAMREMQMPVSRVFVDPAEYILNVDLNSALMAEHGDLQAIRHLVGEITRGRFEPDRETLGYTASKLFAARTKKLSAAPEDTTAMQEIVDIFTILAPLSLDYELWECQNNYFYTGRKLAAVMQKRAAAEDDKALAWISAFRELGTHLGVSCIG
jgi:hypothetical protein